MPKTACDGCHRKKERCLFVSNESSCRQCSSQRLKCSFKRRGRRMGRPPVVQNLPFGICQIFSINASEQQRRQIAFPSSTTPNSIRSEDGTQRVRDVDRITTDITESNDSMSTDDTIEVHGNGDSTEIDNDFESSIPNDESVNSIQINSTSVPIDTSGVHDVSGSYRGYPDAIVLSARHVNFSPGSPSIALGQFHDLPLQDTRHQHVQCILLDRGAFYNYHQVYMIGPSFCDSFHHAIVSVLTRSGGVLLDAYLATLDLWDDKNQRVKSFDEIDVREGSQCLKKLQQAAIEEPLDAAAVIMLGQVLLVYHITVFGTSAYAIVRRSLLSVQKWYPSLLAHPSLNPITITALLVDTVECLVRREVPIIQLPWNDCATVDRSIGLSINLLHIHYEICELSHQAKISTSQQSDLDDHHPSRGLGIRQEQLESLERRVQAWEPSPSVSFFAEYRGLEVSAMLLQARVYRLATLLIIHRLKHALGVKDEYALRLALTISTELDCFISQVPVGMNRLAIGLPLLVSAIETGYLSDQVVAYIAPMSTKSGYSKKFNDFVRLVRSARDNGYRGLWFDLVKGGLHIPVLP